MDPHGLQPLAGFCLNGAPLFQKCRRIQPGSRKWGDEGDRFTVVAEFSDWYFFHGGSASPVNQTQNLWKTR